jgi:hypothetical protein
MYVAKDMGPVAFNATGEFGFGRELAEIATLMLSSMIFSTVVCEHLCGLECSQPLLEPCMRRALNLEVWTRSHGSMG